jgi:hypothetical protein
MPVPEPYKVQYLKWLPPPAPRAAEAYLTRVDQGLNIGSQIMAWPAVGHWDSRINSSAAVRGLPPRFPPRPPEILVIYR